MTELMNNDNDELVGGDYAFTDDDYVIHTSGDGKYVGGGYIINSELLNKGISPIHTLNLHNPSGGDKVSSPFENLVIPAGLFFINQTTPKYNYDKYSEHNTLSDDLHDKLFALVSTTFKSGPIKNKKTKKHIYAIKHKKTKKAFNLYNL